MRPSNHHTPSPRALGIALAVAPVAVTILAAAFYPGKASDLTPLALMLPWLSMGVLESVLDHDHSEHRDRPVASERGRAEVGHSLTHAASV
jgi:hypothetical protein